MMVRQVYIPYTSLFIFISTKIWSNHNALVSVQGFDDIMIIATHKYKARQQLLVKFAYYHNYVINYSIKQASFKIRNVFNQGIAN